MTSRTEFSRPKTPAFSYIGDYFTHVLAQKRILSKLYPGIMHFLLFWGMTLLALGHIVTLMQMALFLPFALSFPRGNLYLTFETISDIAGLALITGAVMAIIRRAFFNKTSLQSRWDDIYALIMLLLIPLLGYVNGALRLTATSPAWASASPIENLVASWFQQAGLTPIQANNLHFPMVLVHLTVGLVLAASVPYTKLRHLVATPLNILLRQRKQLGELDVIPDIEEAELLGAGKIEEFEPHQLLSFDACLRCGRCEDVCPATAVGMDYTPRVLIQSLADEMRTSLVKPGSEGFPDNPNIFGVDYNWGCTTCGACIKACPALIDPVDQVIQLRRYQTLTTGELPKTIADTLRNIERQGNPWGIPGQNRGDWIGDLELPIASPDEQVDVLLYFGCALAFDERNKKIARNIIQILNRLGISYATLGGDEMCCGETARRMGHEYIFQVMAEENISLFDELNFKRIVTPCPHCLNTFKNEYPILGGDYQVQHITELLEETLPEKISRQKNGSTATFHDPCYLGRYNQVLDQPRILASKTSHQVVEMKESKQNSFCCGGGGGQMWLETDADTRINHKRLSDALESGADTILTACPYCLTMFEDAIGAKGLGDQIKAVDLVEAIFEEEIV